MKSHTLHTMLFMAMFAAGCSEADSKKPGAKPPEPPDGKVALTLSVDSLGGDEGSQAAAAERLSRVRLAPGAPRVEMKRATIEGLRFRLREVMADGPQVDVNTVLDWTAEPRVIEAATGFSEQVTGSGRIIPGEYTNLTMHLDNWYAVKGYAFMPILFGSDPATGAAMTMWTTAAGIVTAPGQVAPANFTGYDYWEGEAIDGGVESVETGVARLMTNFAAPVSIAADAKDVVISLRLNTSHLMMAIDGAFAAQYLRMPGVAAAVLPWGRLTGFAFLNEPAVVAETYEWIAALPDVDPYGPPIYDDPWAERSSAFTLVLTPAGEPIMGQMHHYALFQTITGAAKNADGSYRLEGARDETAPAGQGDAYLDGFKRLQVGDAPIPIEISFWNGTSQETSTEFMRRVARY